MPIFERQNFRIARSESDKDCPTVSVGPEIIITDWLLVSVSALFFGLRIYSKLLRKTSLWWDDHVLVVAWLCLILDAIVNTINIRLGFGKHVCNIQKDHLQHIYTLTRLSTTAMMLGAVWSKTSFGLTVLRLTRNRPKVRTLVQIIIATMNSFIIFNVIAVWVQCGVGASGKVDDETYCLSKNFTTSSMMFAGIYSGLMDIVLAILPWCLIWDLHMQRKEKIGIGIAMSMGLFAACTAFVKCSMIPGMEDGDFSFHGYRLVIWGAAEVAATIGAASIPQIRVLAREVVIITHRRHEGTNEQQQPHHMIQLKHTKTSHMIQMNDTKTSHGSDSASGPGCAGPVNAPAAVKLQPRPPTTLTTAQVTSPGYGSTSTAATTDNDRSPNSRISSYTGLLYGVLGGVKRMQSRRKYPERDGHYLHANNTPQEGIWQTQEVSVQVHDREVDPRQLEVGLAV
ncbi:hypothetical protein QBC32DRAFT_315214 [Pseudoneurospora amorphoporcata]|uniref:Rhodopsin domain-containing protein n=1 Tax=Pseudoneurospora amorphoporcata TaxID=241081 RepID=A0AAN6SFH4_9PEZI|nr:hypothetical protein QBC32DRAFT_315214 [Pseudoneurospora amorphoporcata]